MAKFELPIYGENDEIIKVYETDKVRWGVFMQALEVSENLEKKKPAEQFVIISNFVKKIFPDLTDEHLEMADITDVLNTFKQLTAKAGGIGENSKNGIGEE